MGECEGTCHVGLGVKVCGLDDGGCGWWTLIPCVHFCCCGLVGAFDCGVGV